MCSEIADVMSCQAQIDLAKGEVERNMYLTDYMTNHPVCSRYNSLMDRDIESDILHTVGSSKKMCIEKLQSFHSGPWEQQFQTLLGDPAPQYMTAPLYTKYDEQTRAKVRGLHN